MKNTYYQNRSKFSKGSFLKEKSKGYIPPPPIRDRRPKFYAGDLVGFRNYLRSSEGKVLYCRKGGRTGKEAIDYVVELNGFAYYNSGQKIIKGEEMFLLPITRKVLVEKSPEFRPEARREEEQLFSSRYAISGTTYIHHYIFDVKTV